MLALREQAKPFQMDGLLAQTFAGGNGGANSVNLMGDFGPEDDDGWIDVDGGPPELEDMSDQISAARRMRSVVNIAPDVLHSVP